MRFTLDYDQYAALARQTAAEGCVLLKNEKEALPIRKGETVSVFGRIAFTYYKSGTGSGGMVNAPYVTNILDSLKECRDISVNEELEAVYQDWIRENPFDMGEGWAQEPWRHLHRKRQHPLILLLLCWAEQQARTWTTVQSREAIC